MVQSVHTEAGLGNPTVPYYTNDVESKNHILKQHAYYASELPTFVDNMKDLLQQQRKEVERSIIAQGEYKLQENYTKYGVQSAKWFTMTSDQRAKHIDKFMNAALLEPECESSKSSESNTSCPLSVLSHFAVNMWRKAQTLSSSDDAMVLCPGNTSSWMVNRLYAIVPNLCRAHAHTLTAVDPNSGQLQLARTKRS